MQELGCWVGVDPGKNGAVGILFEDGTTRTIRAPKVKGQKGVKEYDLTTYGSIGRMIKDLNPKAVGLELVNAFPGQGVCSMFSLGYGFGAWNTVFAIQDLLPVYIRPQDWRKTYWEPGSLKTSAERKKASIKKANELFPRLEIKHDGEAEALLIARFLQQSMSQNNISTKF